MRPRSPTPEAASELLDCENDPDNLTAALVDSVLEPVIDVVTENPEGISRSSVFDTLQLLLKVRSHSYAICSQLFSCISH